MLKEKYESIRAEAARFARTYLEPWAQEVDRTGEYRPEVFRAVAEAGYAGMVHPKEYGGQGADYLSLCIVTEELCRVDPSASALMMGNTLSGSPLKLFGSEEQKRKYLRPLAAGEKRAAFALTEPEAGCDAANVQTTAVRDGDEYVINGHKRYIIMAPYADFFTVFAKTDPAAGSRGMTAFLVDRDTPGFTVGAPTEKMGIHGNPISELTFENVRVPAENILGGLGKGMHVALGTLDTGRVTVAAQCVGVAQGALDLAVAYAKERVQFGKPLSAMQNTQFKLAEMAVKVEAARQLVYAAAEKLDAGQSASYEAAIAKYYAAEAANEVAYRSVQIHGGAGYMMSSRIEQFYRDARILPIYDGTAEVQLMVISRALLGR